MANLKVKDGIDSEQGINAYIPTGAVVIKCGNPAILSNYDTDAKCFDTGLVPLDGRSLSTTTYSALFNVIGYTHGGSGSLFSVPDMRTSIKYLSAANTNSDVGVTNNSNTITHNHSVLTTQGNFATNATTTNHYHNVSYTSSTLNAAPAHTHSGAMSFAAINSGQIANFTQSKVDGTATASASNHTHVRNAFSGTFSVGAAANNATNTPHSHTQSTTASTATSALPAHTHNASSTDTVTVGTSSSYSYPTINILYFVKI